MHPLTNIRENELDITVGRLALRSGLPDAAIVRYERGYTITSSEKRALFGALFSFRFDQAVKRVEDRRIAKACRELRLLRKGRL